MTIVERDYEIAQEAVGIRDDTILQSVVIAIAQARQEGRDEALRDMTSEEAVDVGVKELPLTVDAMNYQTTVRFGYARSLAAVCRFLAK